MKYDLFSNSLVLHLLFAAAPCPKPESPNFGQAIGNSFQHGSEVRFQCALGYVISGQSVIKCRRGKWSASRPHCVGRYIISFSR